MNVLKLCNGPNTYSLTSVRIKNSTVPRFLCIRVHAQSPCQAHEPGDEQYNQNKCVTRVIDNCIFLLFPLSFPLFTIWSCDFRFLNVKTLLHLIK